MVSLPAAGRCSSSQLHTQLPDGLSPRADPATRLRPILFLFCFAVLSMQFLRV